MRRGHAVTNRCLGAGPTMSRAKNGDVFLASFAPVSVIRLAADRDLLVVATRNAVSRMTFALLPDGISGILCSPLSSA